MNAPSVGWGASPTVDRRWLHKKGGARTPAYVPFALLVLTTAAPADEPYVNLKATEGRIAISVGDEPFAEYRYADPVITRPYLCAVRAPGGAQITRNHPPIEGQDATDHDTFHPGVWLAFGDLSGADFWRLKQPVAQKEVVELKKERGRGGFTVRQQYLRDGQPICDEVCRRTLVVRPWGWLLLWQSEFTPTGDEIAFGDQEEMGLGIRLATPLIVKNGGRIVNSDGQVNEPQVWGKPADWCEYSGEIDGRRLGFVVMPDPRNFRRCWWHARDYGFFAANPFGRKALTGGEESRVVVRRGETFKLGYGVLIFNEDPQQPFDRGAAYKDAVAQLATSGATKPK